MPYASSEHLGQPMRDLIEIGQYVNKSWPLFPYVIEKTGACMLWSTLFGGFLEFRNFETSFSICLLFLATFYCLIDRRAKRAGLLI